MFSAASVGMVVNKNRHPNPQPLVLVAVVPAVNLDLAEWKMWVVPQASSGTNAGGTPEGQAECSVKSLYLGPDAPLMFSAASVGMVVNKNRHPNARPFVLVAIAPATIAPVAIVPATIVSAMAPATIVFAIVRRYVGGSATPHDAEAKLGSQLVARLWFLENYRRRDYNRFWRWFTDSGYRIRGGPAGANTTGGGCAFGGDEVWAGRSESLPGITRRRRNRSGVESKETGG
ncbi:hypothetical protein BS47DRAFT_1358840 [Hydnum rufescens UP504]|uniref:Uncharacterized protein n=1 Tax=Hydnum rufescens UP504 TaxID=1448309 RepID=A0A9P6B6C8_9AGAM|nr:hypothetical protein BS47DRAFT_1358840 [Hydnum rufescens UP504]